MIPKIVGDRNTLKSILIGYIALSPIILAFYVMERFEEVAALLSMLSSFILSLLIMEKFKLFIERIFEEEKKIESVEIIITYSLTLVLFLSIELLIAKEYPFILVVILSLIALIIYIFRKLRGKKSF